MLLSEGNYRVAKDSKRSPKRVRSAITEMNLVKLNIDFITNVIQIFQFVYIRMNLF